MERVGEKTTPKYTPPAMADMGIALESRAHGPDWPSRLGPAVALRVPSPGAGGQGLTETHPHRHCHLCPMPSSPLSLGPEVPAVRPVPLGHMWESNTIFAPVLACPRTAPASVPHAPAPSATSPLSLLSIVQRLQVSSDPPSIHTGTTVRCRGLIPWVDRAPRGGSRTQNPAGCP